MPRRKHFRRVSGKPTISVFKPAGIPAVELDEVFLTVDEFEAVRLADLQGVNQREASVEMHISQPTFNRTLASGRRKIANAIVGGKVLRIEGGEYMLPCDKRVFECSPCGSSIDAPLGTPRPEECPSCGSNDLRRMKLTETPGE
ncbi:MAG: DUF134 domain-containing protein [Candidatus Hodarchaeota archaeon]